MDKPIHELGGKAAFTAELEEALVSHRIDLAVHSLKDLPCILPDDLMYTGSPQREDARDVFVSTKWKTIDDVPVNGIIATGSQRRKAQLLHKRPDLNIQGLRGNIDTRLRKLDQSTWDGIITAAAAMHRLGLQNRISQYLLPDCFVPAGGQGALGLEIATDREDVKSIIKNIIDDNTTRCCKAERLYLTKLEGDCFSPIGCWARIENSSFFITGYSASLDGAHKLQEVSKGSIEDGKKLMKLIQKGHRKIDSIYLMNIGCALGVHAGPGSLAVGLQLVS